MKNLVRHSAFLAFVLVSMSNEGVCSTPADGLTVYSLDNSGKLNIIVYMPNSSGDRFVDENPPVVAYDEADPEKVAGLPVGVQGRWSRGNGQVSFESRDAFKSKAVFAAAKKSAVISYSFNDDAFREALISRLPAGLSTEDHAFRVALRDTTAKVDLRDAQFRFGGVFKDEVGRASISGAATSERAASKGASAVFTSYDLRFGATYFTDGGIIGDARGDQSTTDSVELAYRSATYRRGGKTSIFGVRGRLDAKFKGWEATAYWAPFVVPSADNRFLAALELEAGMRNMTEWKNPVTVSGIQTNAFGRAGFLVEWTPVLGGINKNMAVGWHLYLRGRGWADTFDKAGGGTGVRFRPFFDAELSVPFSDSYRAFVRYENGYLPPDLSKYTGRFFVGVGAKW